MNWFFLSLSAMCFYVAYNLLSRVLAVRSVNPRAFSALYNGIASVLCFLFFFYEPFSWTTPSLKIILLTILGLVIWGLFARAEFATKKVVEISTLTVIIRFYPLVTFAASFIFLGESLTTPKIIAMILIVIANLILIWNKTKISFDRGFWLAIALATSLGLGLFFDKLVSGYYALPLYAVASFGFPSLFNTLTPPLGFRDFLTEWKRSSWRIPLLALTNVIGYYLWLLSLKQAELSKASMILSLAGIVTIILGIWLLGERDRTKQKLAAGALILISLFLLQ